MSLTKLPFSRKLLSLGPIILLYVSVLNEFDFNYLNLKYFSFNFPYILIFYWSLKGEGRLSYVLVFFAGLINDVVVGLPLGSSAISYLVVSLVASYIKNVTVNFSLFTDWFTFLLAIFFSNLCFILLLNNFTNLTITYNEIFYNSFFTFLFYPAFWGIFSIYKKLIVVRKDD